MEFRQWLEWEGNSFPREEDIVNGPEYPNSKYKGKGNKEPEDPRLADVDRKFGFRRKPSEGLHKRSPRRTT